MAQVKQPKLCGYNWCIKVKWSNQNCVVLTAVLKWRNQNCVGLTDVLKYKVILSNEILKKFKHTVKKCEQNVTLIKNDVFWLNVS